MCCVSSILHVYLHVHLCVDIIFYTLPCSYFVARWYEYLFVDVLFCLLHSGVGIHLFTVLCVALVYVLICIPFCLLCSGVGICIPFRLLRSGVGICLYTVSFVVLRCRYLYILFVCCALA